MSEHFPYRRYRRYPLERRRIGFWRRVFMAHDAWAWAFGVFVLAVFLVLEWLR